MSHMALQLSSSNKHEQGSAKRLQQMVLDVVEANNGSPRGSTRNESASLDPFPAFRAQHAPCEAQHGNGGGVRCKIHASAGQTRRCLRTLPIICCCCPHVAEL